MEANGRHFAHLTLKCIIFWNIVIFQFQFQSPTNKKPALVHIMVWHRADNYRKTSNIRRTLAGNKIVEQSDVVGVSPVGAAPTTSSFST